MRNRLEMTHIFVYLIKIDWVRSRDTTHQEVDQVPTVPDQVPE